MECGKVSLASCLASPKEDGVLILEVLEDSRKSNTALLERRNAYLLKISWWMLSVQKPAAESAAPHAAPTSSERDQSCTRSCSSLFSRADPHSMRNSLHHCLYNHSATRRRCRSGPLQMIPLPVVGRPSYSQELAGQGSRSPTASESIGKRLPQSVQAFRAFVLPVSVQPPMPASWA